MFNKINKISTYKNCLHSLNSIDIKSVFSTQLINNNLTKSFQAPIASLSVNNLNNTITSFLKSNTFSSTSTSCLNNKKVNQENENLNKQYHTLNNSKLFNINNISFEPSVEIYQSSKQLNIMVEKTPICEETPEEINLNQDLKKNISKDITSIDINKDKSDGETVINDEYDDDKLDTNNGIFYILLIYL